jgi:type VI secretion system secreted protein VgrG
VQKTRKTEITQDETNLYHASRSTTVDVDELLEVLGKTTIRSGDTITVEAQKDFKQTVGGKASVTVSAGSAGSGDSSTKCDNDYVVEAKTKIHLSQNAVATVTLAGGNADHVTDGVFNVVAKGNLLLDSTSGMLVGRGSTKVEFTQGGGGISIEGEKIAIGSPSEITLTVGGNSIKIDTAGVTVSGAKVDVTATGVCTISGSIVKLN